MNFKVLVSIFLLLGFVLALAEALLTERTSFSGSIKDEANGEAMIGVTVYGRELKTRAMNNSYSFYFFRIINGFIQNKSSLLCFDVCHK
jgi:hypothetical protein